MMTEALIFLSQPETMPFSISLVLMALIGAVSLLGLDFEVGVDAPSIDMDIDADAGIDGISIIDWVNPGRLPFLAALALFLMIYSLIGLAGQQFLEESTGMLPAWLAGIATLPVAWIAWQPVSRLAGRVMPRDHTEAVSIRSLQGRRGTIEIGVATHTSPARALVRDIHGTRHSLMVVMGLPGQEAHEGDEVYLLEIGQDGEPSIAHPAEPRSLLSI